MKYKKKMKETHSILILILVIDLVILNMHMKSVVSNFYTDCADMIEKNWMERKWINKGTDKLQS